MVRKIVTVPSPILRQKATEIRKTGKRVVQLINDLKDTLASAENPKGVGLSAPQIGVSKRVMLITIKNQVVPVVNPLITFSSKETLSQKLEKEKHFLEGCLSVPGYWGFVDRPWKIKVQYQNLEGKQVKQEFEGKDASLFQHEYDHLEGILFIDRILQQKGKIYRIEKNEKGENELVEETLG